MSEPPSIAAASDRAGHEPVQLSWAPPSGIAGLSFVNILLRIVTLGLYHFWGKVEVRRRIWSGIRLQGEPLEYTGTGKELLVGFVRVFLLVMLPLLLISVVVVILMGPTAGFTTPIVFYILLSPLIGLGIYRAQRYRLSRTRWRGIRGGMTGGGWSYSWTHFWTLLLIPFTLGWIVPWRATKLQHLLVNDMRFGNRPFRFTASSRPLYLRFIVVWVGTLALVIGSGYVIGSAAETGQSQMDPQDTESGFHVFMFAVVLGTIAVAYLIYGIISGWYRARTINHFSNHTHIDGFTFKSSVRARSLIWLWLTNYLLLLSTLWLLTPVVQRRTVRYFVERLELQGTGDLGAVAQGADLGLVSGEGVAQAYNVDAF
ncbi:MAG: YjgN family protein [Hyphomicrobiaceae bacterium]